MPTAVTYVLAYVASTAGVAIGSAVLTAAGYIVTAAAVYGIARNQRRKARRRAIDAYNGSLSDRLVMTALADGRRSRVYGRVRNVDGVVFKQTHGTNKEFYTLVISLAGHEVDAIETVYFNEVPVSLDGSGYVTTEPWGRASLQSATETITISGGSGSKTLANTPVAGSVSVTILYGPTFSLDENSYSATPSVTGSDVSVTGFPVDGTAYIHYQYNQVNPKARVRKYLGGASQNLYADLSATVGTSQLLSADRFAGDATLLVTLEYDQDAFPTGLPQISAVVRGAKVLDPRTGSVAWTENPALIARDWALYSYGGGASSAEIVESAFVTAANACDVSTSFTTTSGAEVRPLFQCGIVCPLDADPSATLDEIVESMAGRWAWAGGKLTVRAGVYRAPVAAIDAGWVSDMAAIEVIAQAPTSDLVNVMRPTFSDAAQNYVPAPSAEVRYTAALALDGRELPREVELNGVTRAVHAQHICGVIMRESREALAVKLPCKLHALPLELFDVVTLTLPTFGWVAKEFEVFGWDFSLDGGVMLTLRETAAAIYDPDTSFSVMDLAVNTLLPKPYEVEQITGVTVTSGTATQLDKSVLVRTTVSWTAVVGQAVRQGGSIEVQYTPAATTAPAGDWPSVTVPGNSTSATIVGLGQGVHYVFRVRARSNLGVRGKWSVLKNSQNATVPQVGTDGISSEAVTITRSGSTGSGSTTWTPASDEGGVTNYLTLHTVTLTNTSSATCVVEVTQGSYGYYSSSPATPGVAAFSFEYSISGGGGAGATLSPPLGSGSSAERSFAHSASLSLPAGATLTVTLKTASLIAFGSSVTITYRNAFTRLTAILR